MKRRTLLVVLTSLIPAVFAADHPRARREPKVEYHGVARVNRVEPIIGLVNITHGEVPAFGWQTMTRDLKAKPRTLVSGLVPGMVIKFQLTAVDPLTTVITALEVVE